MPIGPTGRTRDSFGPGLRPGAEIGRESKGRPGRRLRRAVPGKERIITDPAGRDKGLTRQRQHDVSATEHQCAGTVERGKQAEQTI